VSMGREAFKVAVRKEKSQIPAEIRYQ